MHKLLLILFLFNLSASAQSPLNKLLRKKGGVTSPQTQNAGAAVDTAGRGTIAWSNPGNIVTPGTPYATAATNLATSHYLKASHYGFSIPVGVTIDGVVVTINKSMVGGATGTSDDRVFLVKAGVVMIATTNKAQATNWGASGAFAVFTYGASNDLWGNTLTPSDINDPNFGVALSATSVNSSRTFQVDYMQISVYFH